jgi:hypothetical protein
MTTTGNINEGGTRIPGFGNPRFDPFLLGLVNSHLQSVALARTLWITRSIADSTVCRVLAIHVRILFAI